MSRKLFFFLIISVFTVTTAFSGTLFEQQKDVQDPYISERGGVDSLYVNPAGTAGQSGFGLKFKVGTKTSRNSQIFFDRIITTLNTVNKIRESPDLKSLDIDNVENVVNSFLSLLDENIINEDTIKSVFKETNVDPTTINWSDRQEVLEKVKKISLEDYEKISDNFLNVFNANNKEFFDSIKSRKIFKLIGDLKLGFLIKGFGLGTYVHSSAAVVGELPNDAYKNGFLGLETAYAETGIILGGGFNMFNGKLSLGFTGNYGVLLGNTEPIFVRDIAKLLSGGAFLAYGTSWGIDAGVIWRPLPDLSLGLVLNDIIGTTQKLDSSRRIDGLNNLFGSGLSDSSQYEFTTDIDVGITWHPSWRYISSSFSVDLYDFVSYIRSVVDDKDNFGELMERSLSHLRFGAKAHFFNFFNIGFQYYNQYVSFGAGLQMLFLELYAEYKMHNDVIFSSGGNPAEKPFGANISLKIAF